MCAATILDGTTVFYNNTLSDVFLPTLSVMYNSNVGIGRPNTTYPRYKFILRAYFGNPSIIFLSPFIWTLLSGCCCCCCPKEEERSLRKGRIRASLLPLSFCHLFIVVVERLSAEERGGSKHLLKVRGRLVSKKDSNVGVGVGVGWKVRTSSFKWLCYRCNGY